MALSDQRRNAIFHPIRWFFNAETEHSGELPRKELSLYALGIMGQHHGCNMAGGGWFFHFCTNVLKLDPVTVGKMTGLTMVFDGINDPVIGAFIDSRRFRDGRKLLPWIKISSPLVALSAFLMFVDWNLPGTGPRVAYCVAAYMMWDFFYSFQDTAMWGVTAVISPLSSQRARATQWGDNGAFLGSLLPGLLLPMLSGNGAFGLNQRQVYFLFSAVLCLGGGFQSMLALKTEERVRSLPGEKASMLKNIGALRHNYILLAFIASELLRACCPIVSDPYIFQQLTYQVGGKTIPAPVIVTILTAVSGLPGTVMKFFATKIAERAGGMKRIMLIALLTELVTRIARWAIGIKTLPALILVYLMDSISFLPNSLFGIAQRTMLSDSVEYVEWRIGLRTEGVTMSARVLANKLRDSIRRYALGLGLKFLQFDANLVSEGIPQNAHYQKWVWPMFMLGPAIGLVWAAIPLLLLKYPDALKRRVEAEMAQRRAVAGEKIS